MTDKPSTIVPGECPSGHRVRGYEYLLGKPVRCPRCHVEFIFHRPAEHPEPVIAVSPDAPDANTISPQIPDSNADTKNPSTASVSDTGVMRILGNWEPPPDDGPFANTDVRSCPLCQANVPVTDDVCPSCKEHIGAVSKSQKPALGFEGTTADLSASSGDRVGQINGIEFADLPVGRIMQPRPEIDFIDINDPLHSVRELMLATMHTRYPVCDGSLDKVLGVVHIKNLLVISPDSVNFDIRSIIEPAGQVPETFSLSQVFRHLRASHRKMGLVTNAGGAVTGLVTLESVLATMLEPDS
ncbi:MAG: CBS domain-containing protein [Pirellulaceae bacterium]|nr:CBS domain-containing protein [Pirellulaceae bacterium]